MRRSLRVDHLGRRSEASDEAMQVRRAPAREGARQPPHASTAARYVASRLGAWCPTR